jgi:hypothetical protein
MITPEVRSFVKQSRTSGKSDTEIKQTLMGNGWNAADADEAIRDEVATPAAPAAPAVPVIPQFSAVSFSEPRPHHKKRNVLIVAGIAILVLIVGATAYGYSRGAWPFGSSDATLVAGLSDHIGKIDWTMYKSELSLKSEPRDADATPLDSSLLGLPIDDYMFSFLGSDSSIVITASGISQTKDSTNRGIKSELSGVANLGDLHVEAAADFVSKDDTFYIRVNKFPSLFTDLGPIKEKWVGLSAKDVASTSGFSASSFLTEIAKTSNSQGNRAAEVTKQVLSLYKIATEESFITLARSGSNGRAHLFRASIDPSHASDFYQRATTELATAYGTSSIMTYDRATAEYVASPEFAKTLQYLQNNLDLEIGIDSVTGYPASIMGNLRIVVPNSKANTQIRLVFSTELSNVNKSSDIEAPSDVLSFEDAMIALSGKTKEEYLADQQISQVRTLRYDLSSFKSDFGVYPESLNDLTLTYNQAAQKYDKNGTTPWSWSPGSSYGDYPINVSVPVDVYSKAAYSYQRVGTDYHVIYTVRTPASAADSSSFTYDQYTLGQVANGLNTATSKTMSIEGDLLPTPSSPSSENLPSGSIFEEGRDANRISDMATLKSSLSLYLADVPDPVLCKAGTIYSSDKGTTATDGTGWLPVNLQSVSSGSPISRLPQDPVNKGSHVYRYSCDPSTLTFELDTDVESSRYGYAGSGDVESTDGGNDTKLYEVGTTPGLKLLP